MSRAPRVVVVTGGTSGVGRATVRALVERGDSVAVVARGQDGLDATQREARAQRRIVVPVRADVARADEVENAATWIEDNLGPIDAWVNNAMATIFASA